MKFKNRWMPVVTLATVIGVLSGGLVATPASAAVIDAGLSIDKTVNGLEAASIEPGDEFTYSIAVGCFDNDCVAAALSDTLPAAFDGFPILNTALTPSGQPATVSYEGCTGTVTTGCTLNVAFGQDLGGGAVGILAGDGYQVNITLRAPQTLPATWPSNGVAITNTATATADNALPRSDGADVTVTIPVVVDTAVGKSWEPGTQQFSPGVESTITLTTQNTSNVFASTLVVQDPASAVDGASSLGADNPFTLVDFAGFDTATLPQGADLVQVDAYVLVGGTYQWVTGSPVPVAEIALPGGVDPSAVAGLRITASSSTGATLNPGGTAGSTGFTVAQRTNSRVTGAGLETGASVTNTVAGTVTVPDQPPVTKQASAPYAIGKLTVAVAADKQISPSKIPASTTAAAVLTATNTSNGPVTELTLSDRDFFTQNVLLDAFTAPIAYPEGATAAQLTWRFSDGSTAVVSVADGATPVVPAAPAGAFLTGFDLRFTGTIAAGADAPVRFAIRPTVGLLQPGSGPGDVVSLSNSVTTTAKNVAGTATSTDTAPLDVYYPDIEIAIDKTIQPGGPVSPGATVVAQLPTTTRSDTALLNPNSIVVTDVWAGPGSNANEFFNAFNPLAIAPTQILGGSSLLVEYTTDAGATWQTLQNYPAQPATRVVQQPIPAALVPVITGLRFTFDNPTGFAQGTTVSPNVVYQARGTLRDGGEPTSLPGEGPSTYQNTAAAQGKGSVPGLGPIVSTRVEDVAPAQIVTNPGDVGTLLAAKTWLDAGFGSDLTSLPSQSGDRAGTRLGWGVTDTGYTDVVIADPNGGETTPGSTVFQAFDLVAIQPISFSQDPLLRWDTITTVELYNATAGAWQSVPVPAGGWMSGSGFKGYTLTAAEQARTTGVRFTVTPNDAARANSSDPLAPPVGSGVATSAAAGYRPLNLLWQLRNVVRDPAGLPDQWVRSSQAFNGGPGAIVNTVGVSGTINGTPVGPRQAEDTVILIDQPPAVTIAKSSQRANIVVPQIGDVPATDYPTNAYSIVASNASSSRASYVRVSDPQPCAAVTACVSPPTAWGADPYATAAYDAVTNPFERFTLTGIDFTVDTAQVSRDASTVTLWRRAADGTLSTTTVSLTQADALTAATLSDVVGVSVLYQGANPSVTGGTIDNAPLTMTLNTQLRQYNRSRPTIPVQPTRVDNAAFTQGYDPVLFPSGPSSVPNGSAQAAVQLLTGNLGVDVSKTITPTSLIEARRTDPVTVRLTANQGNQTVATNQVTVQDVDQRFWNRFRLNSFAPGDITFPAGANRVDVGVQLDGAPDWITTGPTPTASLPALPPGATIADVTGIRFVYTRVANGQPQLLSNTAPPKTWTTTANLSVRVRDADRATGDAIPFDGTTTPNEVTAVSERFDGLYAPAQDADTAGITLNPGTFRIDVSKDPQGGSHTVSPGDPNEWTLKFRNTGTGFLTITSLVDTLPTTLEWDGNPPTVTTSPGGTLSTAVTTTYDSVTRAVTLTWPVDGQRMSPNETVTIKLGITLLPGLTGNQRATNPMVVNTAQTLAACTNTSGNGQGTIAGLAPTSCGTTNYVQPVNAPNIFTLKGVKGDVVDPVDPANPLVSGAVNVVNPRGPCVPDAEGYYRQPCAANTVVNAQDEWKIFLQNSGAVAYNRVTIVDPLPFPGDKLLETASNRGSTYRPAFTGPADLQLIGVPTGATAVVEVTTVSGIQVCVGAGTTSAWTADPRCATHPAAGQWTPIGAYTGDWGAVTGLRITVDYRGRSDQPQPQLLPGQSLTVKYRTMNKPAAAGNAQGAPVTVPVGSAFAWNQNGAVGDLVTTGTRQRTPVRSGVTPAVGSVQVSKAITGAGSQYAPDRFTASVACVLTDGTPVNMGSFGTVVLDAANSYTARIDGIPLGATCTVTEDGPPGEFGESSRTVTPASVLVRTVGSAATPVPSAQQITVTNDYALTSLVVSKSVVTQATVGSFGPFAFTVACRSALGAAIPLAPEDASFTLTDGQSRTIADLPVRAECAITETDSDGATTVTSVAGGTSATGPDASLTLVEGANTAAYTNTYAAGTLSVTKTVAGAGGPTYGSGPFTVAVSCTYGGETVYEGSLSIVGGETQTLPEVFPVGTQCAVTETGTGGANDVAIDPPSVTIVGPVGTEPIGSVTVDVTNTFNVGQLALTKVRDGAGADTYGAGPFTALVSCTWVKDGVTLTIPLPDGGVVDLSEANGYSATVEGLIQGATCAVTETATGGATAVTFDPADPSQSDRALVTVPADADAAVTITNTFLTGSLVIDKNRVGDGVDLFGGGPFQAQVTCTYLKDGVVTGIALPDDGVIVLSEENGYSATLDGLLVGARCSVTETDAGLAVSTTLDPTDGTVTITADGDPAGAAVVTITNRFDIGHLSIAKSVSDSAALVGDTLTYRITVTNDGQIDATAVTVRDTPPASLAILSTDPNAIGGGQDATGALNWTIDSLPVGASRVFTVTARALAVGTVTNTASVSTPTGSFTPSDPATAQTLVTQPLPATGASSVAPLVLGAAGLLLAGILLLMIADFRRRRRAG